MPKLEASDIEGLRGFVKLLRDRARRNTATSWNVVAAADTIDRLLSHVIDMQAQLDGSVVVVERAVETVPSGSTS